jgi:2-phospho-L-lactate/phosphoenolpyruvate guanylyltransferase
MAVWAVVPVKECYRAKERLTPLLAPAMRQALALAMLEDVLSALAAVSGLSGIIVVTADSDASRLAAQYRARILKEGARDGHTGAVAAAARWLTGVRDVGMLTLPGDIPLVSAGEIEQIIAAHHPAPSFTIVPSHDEGGSNAILLSPPDAVPLRFGVNSFYPHLRMARERGIYPTVLRLPGIALDLDNPEDLAVFMQRSSSNRARALLAATIMPAPLAAARF